jgi:hypothetical protein
LSKKTNVGRWPYAAVAFLPLANLLSESEMMEWANTTIACTEDYMAGAFVDQSSQKPWKSPPSWASTDQYLVVQVRVWLRTIATRTGGVVDPIIKISLEDYGISHIARSISEWMRRRFSSTKSTNPKSLLVPSPSRDA